MLRVILSLLSVWFYIVNFCESARILAVFPTPSISHQVVFQPLTQELARRGHEVIVLTTDPVFSKGNAPKNLTEIDVHDISYDYWRKEFLKHATGKKEDLQLQVKVVYKIIGSLFEMQLENSEFKQIIEGKQHFDLLLLEAWVRPILVLSHIFKAPVIQMSSFGRSWQNYEDIGAPVHPLLYPLFSHHRLYNLTIWEKLNELYDDLKYTILVRDVESYFNEQIKRIFGSDTPNLDELSKNIEMLFLNIHPIWEGNNPVPPAVVHTWGLHQKPEKQLPMDLKMYLDKSKNGVIYMSFGTNTDPANLPSERIQMFINVFSKLPKEQPPTHAQEGECVGGCSLKLPYEILWKWNQEVLPGKTENIRISKWFPQSDLLKHPKIKLFITQGGLQSTDEAITAGVPLIGIPMLGDQWYNTEKYEYHGIGKKLNIETVTEKDLQEAIDEVIGNERYRNNIKKLGELMADQPQKPLERAVWWVEHVLRHGGARHMRAPAAGISWAQYLEIELVAILVVGFVAIFTMLTVVLYFMYSYVTRNYGMSIKLKSN